MARALRDAGFKVMVELYTMVLDGREYEVDADLIQWQQDAINDEGMIPIAMQLDFEHRSVKFLKTLPWSHTKQDRKWRGLKISHRQPGNTAQRLKPEQARNTAGIPLQTHQPEPNPEILYIREQWVNYYIARENKIVFF